MTHVDHKSGLRAALLVVMLSLLGTVALGSGASAATLDGEEAALCRLVNEHRAQNGLGPLRLSTTLTNAAEWHSADMAQRNYFSHTDSLGRDPFRRMADFGYPYATAKGENIAAGSSTAAATFGQWRSSPGHNANMLNRDYAVMGIGRAYGATSQFGWYWTNTFGGFDDGSVPCPAAALPAFSVNDISVTETNSGTTTATFTVTRSGDTSGQSSVTYATADGTAVAGGDYVAVPPTTLSFAPGETSKRVAVTVKGDTVVEPTETFFLRLSAPTGATVADGSGTATIQNDDSPASLRVNDISFGEGNHENRTASFTVFRSGDTSGYSSVTYATADGTAVAGVDYLAIPPTRLTFAPGETSKPVTVTSIGDTIPEPVETFFLGLSSPSGATIFDGSGTATLHNADDGTTTVLPSLRVNDISFGEGNHTNTTGTFTVFRSGDTSGYSSVTYATADGTAVAGVDYVAIPPTRLTFAPGETSKPVTVTSIGDTIPEPVETFFLRLSSPSGATIFDGSGTATLHNADDGL